MMKEDYDSAIECFEQVFILNPEFENIWNILGLVHESAGNFDKAIECYEKGLLFNLDDVDLLNRIASAYGKIGNHEKVIEYSEKISRLEPNKRAIFNIYLFLNII